MAVKKKIIKKKLQEPDEFISFTDHAFRFISRHYKRIITGAVILGVLVAAFFLYQKWEENREAKAYQSFRSAVETYQTLVFPYREAPPAEVKRLIETFDGVIAKFPRTSSGRLALLYKGNLHLKAEEWDEAIKAFESFLQKAGKERLYRLFAMEGLGYAYEGKKEYEKAADAYGKMLETGEGLQVANAHLGRGRCYEKLGKKKEALESYKTFLQVAPKAMMANVVSRKISHLED